MLSRRRRAVALAGLLMLGPAAAKADVVLEWNQIAVTTVSGQNAVEQARVAAIAQLAVFEAVNAITGDYAPYIGTITARSGASAEAATIAAAHRVLTQYVPEQQSSLDDLRARSLAAIPDNAGKNDGIAVGIAAADALIALREHDGSQPPLFHVPASTAPGVWQLTPSCPPSGGLFLHWRGVTPFGIKTSDQFRAQPPPGLSSRTFIKDVDEVKSVGAVDSVRRPQDRADVARFYAAVLATPLWNAVATQIATAQGRSLSDNARALALVNLTISDALVAVFDSKYHYNFWRPETAINAVHASAAGQDRPASAFRPFIVTPCHPSYPSAHAAAAYAAREVLRRIYGRTGHVIDLSVASLPDVRLHYTSLAEITGDIDDARVFGGIHFRFDQRAGARQGRRLGAYAYKHNLRPVYVCDVEGERETEMETDGEVDR